MLDDPYYRATGYPYVLSERSYVIEGGRHWYPEDNDPVIDLRDRTPVLAVGSNMSPLQLGRKFPKPENGRIPVTRVRLQDFDSVYSTHFTSYGAIPATLFPSDGTTVTLFITWLDTPQLERMHATEVPSENYGFYRIEDVTMTIDWPDPDAVRLDHVFCYLSSRGAVSRDGKPIAMAEAPAERRQWTALDQRAIQVHARDLLAPGAEMTDFVRQNIDDPVLRDQRTDGLHRSALPFDHTRARRIDT